jgi:uncharacterized membrane protein YhaH (DUF805 family)
VRTRALHVPFSQRSSLQADSRRQSWLGEGVSALIGLVCGAGALFEAFYGFHVWGVLAIGAMIALAVAVAVGREAPPPMALLPSLALAGLAAVQFASVLWAESSYQALTEAHRTAFYAAVLGLFTLLASRQRRRLALLAGVTAGALLVGGYEAVRLLGESPSPDFIRGRLQDPLGYVNGMAAALLVAVWPLVGAAEGARTRLGGALGVSGASFLLALGVLVQSRGGLAALMLSALLVCALLPGRGTRLMIILVLAAGLAVGWGALTEPFNSTSPETGLPAAGTTRDAILVAFAVAAVCGLAFALFFTLRTFGRPRVRAVGVRSRRVAGAAVVLVTLSVVVLVSGDLVDATEERWTEFQSLHEPSPGSRLSSAGGNRYDYWRVAVDQFGNDPLKGVGAGNYDRTYFLERRTSEDIRQPHSLPLQVLGETGLLGFVCLLAFVLVLALTVRRARPVARKRGADRALMVGATGTVGFWLVYTSVDWIYLLPSVTGAALVGISVLSGLAAWAPAEGGVSRLRPRALIFAGAVLVTASLGVLLLADWYRERAVDRLSTSPHSALRAAQQALELNDDSLPNYFALAAAQARLDRYGQARSTLLEASLREPHDWLPPALLGDLALRRGDFDQARRDYRKAFSLNPRSGALADLVERAAARQREPTVAGGP